MWGLSKVSISGSCIFRNTFIAFNIEYRCKRASCSWSEYWVANQYFLFFGEKCMKFLVELQNPVSRLKVGSKFVDINTAHFPFMNSTAWRILKYQQNKTITIKRRSLWAYSCLRDFVVFHLRINAIVLVFFVFVFVSWISMQTRSNRMIFLFAFTLMSVIQCTIYDRMLWCHS